MGSKFGVSSCVRKVLLTPLLALVLFGTQALTGAATGFAVNALVAVNKAQPNRFDPKSAATSILHRPQTSAAKSAPAPMPYTPPRRIAVAMQPARMPLDSVQGAHFVGSDGVLEFDVPAGAVSAADVSAAGGSMSLLVRQVLPASGGNAGGSGHYSFGTYLVQLLDASGKLAKQGLRKSVTFKLHHDKRAQALDLRHTQVLINPSLPTWFDPNPPTELPALGSPSSGGPT